MVRKDPKSLELLQSSLRCSCALRRSGHKAWEGSALSIRGNPGKATAVALELIRPGITTKVF